MNFMTFHLQPFSYITQNPSWLAVAPLHNTVIKTASASIHITTVGPVRVAYEAVLSLVPGLHARPPRLPSLDSRDIPMPEPAAEPPAEGYDFVFHLGAGNNGKLSIEQVGHKSGYRSPGVDGKLAPVMGAVPVLHATPSVAEQFEAERLRRGTESISDEGEGEDEDSGPDDNGATRQRRGFAEGYECFPEELHTEIDVPGVIEHLKQQGETVSPPVPSKIHDCQLKAHP